VYFFSPFFTSKNTIKPSINTQIREINNPLFTILISKLSSLMSFAGMKVIYGKGVSSINDSTFLGKRSRGKIAPEKSPVIKENKALSKKPKVNVIGRYNRRFAGISIFAQIEIITIIGRYTIVNLARLEVK